MLGVLAVRFLGNREGDKDPRTICRSSGTVANLVPNKTLGNKISFFDLSRISRSFD